MESEVPLGSTPTSIPIPASTPTSITITTATQILQNASREEYLMYAKAHGKIYVSKMEGVIWKRM
jgi:hypothetical protein